jgi:hypothetical protein
MLKLFINEEKKKQKKTRKTWTFGVSISSTVGHLEFTSR